MIGELKSITALRGMAVWTLIACAAIAPPAMPFLYAFLFLLSGFTTYLSSSGWRRAGDGENARRYITRRLWALAPGIAISASLAMLLSHGRLAEILLAPILAMTAAIALAPLLTAYAHIQRLRRPQLLALMMILAALLQPVEQFIDAYLVREALALLILWIAGALLCAFWLRGPDGDSRALRLSLTGAVAAAIFWFAGVTPPQPAAAAAGLLLTLAAAHASSLRANPLHRPAMLWIGRSSYLAWLAHLPILAFAQPSTGLRAVGLLVATLAVTLLLTPALGARAWPSSPHRRPSAR